MAFGIRRPSSVVLIRVQLLDPSRRLKNIDPIFNKGTRSISTSSEVIAGAGPCMQPHLKTRRPCLPTSRWKRVHALACPVDTHLDSLYLSQVGGFDFWPGDWKAHRCSPILWLMSKTSPRARNQPLMYHVSGPDFLAGGDGGACSSAHALWANFFGAPFLDRWKHWGSISAMSRRWWRQALVGCGWHAAPPSYTRFGLVILSLEGAHMLGPRGVRSQALRLRRLDIAANAGAAYLMLNHFSHPDISQAGYASLNPWRGRKGAGLRVRHRIRGRASCMTAGASRRVALTRATNCRRCDAVSHRERTQPSLS